MGINSKRRGRPAIKPAIRQLIAAKVFEYPDLDRLQLAALITKEIEAIGEKPPAEDTLVKKISEARNKETDPLDAPWHLGKLEDNPLPAEAVPVILAVQALASKQIALQPYEITIRQALWIARLYKTVETFLGTATLVPFLDKKDKGEVLLNQLLFLFQWSEAYANRERICRIAGIPFDSSLMDRLLAAGTFIQSFNKTVVGKIDNTAIVLPLTTEDADKDLANSPLSKLLDQIKKEGEK